MLVNQCSAFDVVTKKGRLVVTGGEGCYKDIREPGLGSARLTVRPLGTGAGTWKDDQFASRDFLEGQPSQP
jgi:hypothetical protein